MLLDIEQDANNKKLRLSYFNDVGKVEFEEFDTSDIYNHVVCDENERYISKEYKNWDGRPVKKYKGKQLSKHTITKFIETLSKESTEKIFSDFFPKTYFFDIETEFTGGKPQPEIAPGKVLTISLATPEQKVLVMGLKDQSSEVQGRIANKINKHFEKFNANWEYVYKKFDSEYDMLYTFMKMVSKLPMLSGWYCIDFDWTYLVNRCKRLQIDPSISSPVNKLNTRGKHLPYHVGIVDYKDLYMNWDRSISPKENGKLETAGKQVLGMGKIQHDGLENLYDDDFETYCFYNAVDSCLVYYIDQKLKTMRVVLTLANICKISLYKASSPVSITESIISRNLLKENKIMASDFNQSNENKKTGKYTGAFVKAPVVGKHRGVACFDYASLYPSIMRQFNISPDSYIEKLPDNIKDEKRKQLHGDKIVTSYGGLYSKEDSILKKVLTNLYAERKSYKKESFMYKTYADQIKQKLKKM